MAITQTISNLPPAPQSTDPTNFRTKADAFVSALNTFEDELNLAIPQMNELETNVNSKEASASASALVCTSAANFQGNWTNQTTVVGQSWAYNGLVYLVIVAGNTSPTASPSNWMSLGIDAQTHAATSKTTPVDADEVPIVDSASSFGLKKLTLGNLKATLALRKNYLINGNFDKWDYATSQTTSGYGSDNRWNNSNTGSTKTASQQTCTDTERALFNAMYFSRTSVSSSAGSSNLVAKQQLIENVNLLAGKTVTLSFWAKADANKNIAVELTQGFGTGGSPSAGVSGIGSQLVALTTTWQKKTITVTLPSIVGKTLGTDGVQTTYTGLNFWFDAGSNYASRSANLGQQSGTFDIAQVKIEDGSVATNGWHPYDGEFGGEVEACQRYYETVYCTNWAYAAGATSGAAGFLAKFNVNKRVIPTLSSFSVVSSSGTNTYSMDSINLGMCRVVYSSTGSGTVGVTGTFTATAEL
jgi:hypothetical protein